MYSVGHLEVFENFGTVVTLYLAGDRTEVLEKQWKYLQYSMFVTIGSFFNIFKYL